ncbi:hypothetical protein [Saccharothrix syringae]|uniref:DUF2530 domain-containing protein n=1 Tax=Saccharothrix syringae TaxID=103733 RepID=A0A5Q0HBS9_SACSY|nr:hypothetical protein [Saccharothrix syringae]QFZ23405.1 hypothetical protein EKG83_43540 [Saccharothrix syringae]
MADRDRSVERRDVDVVGLVLGVAALVASAYVLSDGTAWPAFLDLRWALAGGAMVIGIGLLAASLRRRG